MNFCRLLGLLSVLGWTAWAAPADPTAPRPAPRAPLMIHWLGLNRISADTNAAQFLSVWHLPQTTALVAQTLDKISRLPGHGATNAAAARLRPLLDDLLTNECYLELFASTNPPSSIPHLPSPISPSAIHQLSTFNYQLLAALRLPPDRARLWQTNLPSALPSAQVSQSRDWTLIALGESAAAQLPAFTARVSAFRNPHSALSDSSSQSNVWLEADLDPSLLNVVAPQFFAISHLPSAISSAGAAAPQLAIGNWQSEMSSILNLPSSFTNLHLSFIGNAGAVHTRATLDFAQPLNLTLSPWEIPTNYIHAPLTCFTAVRGLAPWLAALPAWTATGLLPPPDQAFVWAQVQAGGPFVTYFAFPLLSATNQLTRLAGRIMPHGNAWLATNAQGTVEWQSNQTALVWHDAFIIDPFLKPVTVNHHDYLLGGLIPFAEGNPNPMPPEMVRAVLDTTNLVYYSAELTGSRIEDDFFIIQLIRVLFHQPQLPAAAPGTLWLKYMEPLIGPSTTVVTQKAPAQLALSRVSTIGFTALELHLLADWLESPQFPRGLHTFLAPPDK